MPLTYRLCHSVIKMPVSKMRENKCQILRVHVSVHSYEIDLLLSTKKYRNIYDDTLNLKGTLYLYSTDAFPAETKCTKAIFI